MLQINVVIEESNQVRMGGYYSVVNEEEIFFKNKGKVIVNDDDITIRRYNSEVS